MFDRSAEPVGRADLGGIDLPTGSARGLPGRLYFDPAAFDQERRTIFRKSWFAATYASDLPAPGDIHPVSIAGWELLLVRARDGAIRCFHNICRHRGMKLVERPGNAQRISCRYHCWTYGLDGSLLATPHLGGPGINQGEGIHPEQLGLREVRCAVWRDIVFVDVDGVARPLDEHFRQLETLLAEYELDGLQLAAETTPEQEVPFNWKIQIEGGIESYHLPWVHPQLELPPMGYRFEADPADAFIGFKTPMSDAEMKRRAAGNGASEGPVLPNFPVIDAKISRGEAPQFLILFVLPNVTAVVMPNYLVLGLLRPLAVDRTVVRRKFYYVGAAAGAPGLAGTRSDIARIWHEILQQDIPFLAEVQKMCRVRDEAGMSTRFSPYWEVGLHMFQKYVARNALA
ncbi:MAG: aromatic ring-hydroxylating dioxygenase subunit alpha [Alphaproteobacteria bacterium]|nr:aromatic ring-hydroxylating dioxygenase subunit alpha [Alphaproteobacteria bacterium]